MFKYRILTAIVFIPIIFLVIWYLPPFYFALFMGLIVAVGAWEWSNLIGFTNKFFRSVVVIAILLGLMIANYLPIMLVMMIGFLMLIWSFISTLSYQMTGIAYLLQHPSSKILLAIMTLIPFWVGLMFLKTRPLGPTWLLLVILIVWATDTGAYFWGRAFGEYKLIPKVSPNKTWQGFFAGLFFGLLTAIIVSFLLPLDFQQRFLVYALAFFAALFSVVGDLQISLLKRLAAVKDTGQIFPGHGGMLDRIDSLAAAIIVFALGMAWLGLGI